MHIILHLAALTLTVLVLARFVPGVRIQNVMTAFVVAVVFSLLNFFFGWLIRVVLIVPAILTLGLLFLVLPFVVNTILLWLTDKLLRAFEISSFGSLLISAAAITLVNGLFHVALHPRYYQPMFHSGLHHGVRLI
jgi:putative membrane protein